LIQGPQAIAFLNELGILSQNSVYILFTHFLVIYSDLLDHFQFALHPLCLAVQFFVDTFGRVSLVRFLVRGRGNKTFCLLTFLNQLFKSFTNGFYILIAVGNL
jgi:hypothetical protein